MSKWSALSGRPVAVAVTVVAGCALLTAAGYGAQEVGHPPPEIQSMGEVYQCNGDAALSRAEAQSRESAAGATLHVVGWVPLTHAVYGMQRAAPDVYVRYGNRYFACLVSRSALHGDHRRDTFSIH